MEKQKYTYDEIFQRNIGVLKKRQQESLRNSMVSIAGLGGIGGILFERLVRLGIENFKVAEPDSFEISNLNRMVFSNLENIREQKVEVIVEECKKINSNIKVQVYKQGVNNENVEEFTEADIVIDAIEYNLTFPMYLLHETARNKKKTVLAAQALGFGASLYVFNDKSISFADYIGLKNPEHMTAIEINNFKIPMLKFCPKIPKYVPKITALNVALRKNYIPSCSLGVMAAASLLEMAIILHILKLDKLPLTPDYMFIDFYELLKGQK
ncbi:MAG: ThiF family adenylyltransferase [bacterium]